MTGRKEMQGLVREVLVRLRREDLSLDVIRAPMACPDEPRDHGITRRDLMGRLGLLLAGAAAFKLQGCGACNDFAANSGDGGGDGGDAGDAGNCTLADNKDAGCTTDTCTTDACTTDTCTTEACTTETCTTETCTTETCTSETCTLEPTCSTDTCTTESSFF